MKKIGTGGKSLRKTIGNRVQLVGDDLLSQMRRD